MKSSPIFNFAVLVLGLGFGLAPHVSRADSPVAMIYRDSEIVQNSTADDASTTEHLPGQKQNLSIVQPQTLVLVKNRGKTVDLTFASSWKPNKALCGNSSLEHCDPDFLANNPSEISTQLSSTFDNAIKKSIHSTSITFINPEKAAAFENLVNGKDAPEFKIVAADVVTSGGVARDKINGNPSSSDVWVKTHGSSEFIPLDDLLAKTNPTAKEKVLQKVNQLYQNAKMDFNQDIHNASATLDKLKYGESVGNAEEVHLVNNKAGYLLQQ